MPDDSEELKRLAVFEAVQRLTEKMKNDPDASEICRVIKEELQPLLRCEKIVFLRYHKDTGKIEILAGSDKLPDIPFFSNMDEASMIWAESIDVKSILVLENLDSVPALIKHLATKLECSGGIIYCGEETDDSRDLLAACVRNFETSSPKIDKALTEFFAGAFIVLHNVQMMNEVSSMRTDIQSSFDMAPVGIVIIDSNGYVVKANEQAMKNFGCGVAIDDLVGENLVDGEMFKGSGIGIVVAKALDGEDVDEENLKFICPSGRICYLHTRFSPVRQANGKVQVIGVLTDITQRIRLQQQLERSYSTLTEAFQELQRVDKMKTKFIDIVSHELRTPLTVMRGYLDLLDTQYKDKIDPKVMGKIQNIKTNTDRLYEIVEAMLDVARIEQGAMEITKQDASIRSIIEEVVATQKALAHEKHQEVTIVTVGEIGRVRLDVKKMHDAIKNLVNNAIRYTPENGKVQVGISDEGKMVHIWVKDNGIGIPLSELEKIFDRFYIIAAKDLSHQVDRMGLSLPITKGIVESHGGKIWVESEPGKGSIFHINLPKE